MMQKNEAGEGSRTIAVRLEQDTLECPICFDMFLDSIFQASTREFIPINFISYCTNGHAVCERCCDQAAWGASSSLRKASMRRSSARHASSTCPVKGCAYSGVDLHDHIRDAHRDDPPEHAVSGAPACGGCARVPAVERR
ncbi:hypothetical protein EJB05_31825, partial [Eragrostis curvula]